MNYQFKKYKVSQSSYFDVDIKEEKYYVLNNFTSHDWTPSKAQEIIDGVESSTQVEKEESYEWETEDIYLQSNKNGVLLYDLSSDRAGTEDPKKLNFVLTHNEFISFMQDFKTFIEENQ